MARLALVQGARAQLVAVVLGRRLREVRRGEVVEVVRSFLLPWCLAFRCPEAGVEVFVWLGRVPRLKLLVRRCPARRSASEPWVCQRVEEVGVVQGEALGVVPCLLRPLAFLRSAAVPGGGARSVLVAKCLG